MDKNSQAYQDAFARIRAAIKSELVDENMSYPEGWHGGWLHPGTENTAEYMLDDIAAAATRAAFGIESSDE